MLITDDYRELNRKLHEQRIDYGVMGKTFAPIVRGIANSLRTQSILDYGCGKCGLEAALGFSIANYDPAIPGLDAMPVPADIVACNDVLEHVEPDFVEAVLNDLRRCTVQMLVATVATVPASKALPDGSNPHRSVHPWEWWFERLNARWRMKSFADAGNGFVFIGRPR